jgi:TolB-like protein
MSSIIEGYNYDIFISYRQKDNKGDRWVSEFVEALETELESTFKEEISVYFDINPHDGLLETYDVDASLKDKLKCLVFIPIISRTYCDPKSFAWEHEFKAFVEEASKDQFGLKVKLPGGNVASRVLPVRIHDLDNDDIKLCESLLGSVLRGIEFIYKESGVNRPVTLKDNEEKNLNKTNYRNQINKVALAIKSIITTIEHPEQKTEGILKEVVNVKPEKAKKLIPKTIVTSVIILALIVLGYCLIVTLSKPKEHLEKSIAVLPFRNDSHDSTTTIFMDGVMEEILNRLQAIKELIPISRSSVEQYRITTKSLPEIARERNVNYVLEGSGQKFGDSIILRVQLIEVRNGRERHLMGSSFRQKLESANTFFNIQSLVAQSIASELNARITPQEKKLIEKLPTDNLEAYEAYLKGQFYLNKFTPSDLDSAMQYFELAKKTDPKYAVAYTGICDVWSYRQQWGLITPAEGNPRSMQAVMKAYVLDSNNAVVQYTLASKKVWGMFDWAGGETGFKKSISLNPNNAMTHAVYSHLLNLTGRPEEAMGQIDIALKLDPMNPFITTFYGIDLYMTRKYDEAIKAYNDALNLSPGYPFTLTNLWLAYQAAGRTEEAYATLKFFWSMFDPQLVKSLEQGYLKDGFKGALLLLADRLVELWTNNPNQFFAPTDIASLYSLANETDKALNLLERAYNSRDPNIPYLLFPTYDNLRNNPRFQDLCRRMNLPYKPKL